MVKRPAMKTSHEETCDEGTGDEETSRLEQAHENFYTPILRNDNTFDTIYEW